MAPLSPPLSAEAPEISKRVSSPSASIPCSCLLSSAFRHLLPRPHPPSQTDPAPPLEALQIQLRMAAAAAGDRCVRALAEVVSESPLLKLVSSLSSDFQRFRQMQCRKSNNSIRSENLLSTHNFAAILPGDSVAGLVVANGITNFLNIYNTLLVVRLVLTWFPGAPPAIVSPLSTLCDPYLNIFRGIIPPLGGTLDLSPILAFLVLNAFTSTAAALPAELPAAGKLQHEVPSSPWMPLNLTTQQQKWVRRICSKQNKN